MEKLNIKQYLQKAIDFAIDGNTRYLVTFEHITEPQYWFQLRWDMVNVTYPFTANPALQLKQWELDTYRQHGLELGTWEAGQYCTLEHGSTDLDNIVDFIMQYFKKALDIADDTTLWKVKEHE